MSLFLWVQSISIGVFTSCWWGWRSTLFELAVIAHSPSSKAYSKKTCLSTTLSYLKALRNSSDCLSSNRDGRDRSRWPRFKSAKHYEWKARCLIATYDICWHLILCSFQRTHSLLCRWQEQLEFFLFHLCRLVAPALAEEFHWSCSEAAELSQLSEKVTEYFCFHHKELFRTRNISDKERESFCSDLHKIRQIRHCAVHRVVVNATTIAKYARSAHNVLAILKRLGGTEFQNIYGGQVRLVSLRLLSSILLIPYIIKVGAVPSVILGRAKAPSATIRCSPTTSPKTKRW